MDFVTTNELLWIFNRLTTTFFIYAHILFKITTSLQIAIPCIFTTGENLVPELCTTDELFFFPQGTWNTDAGNIIVQWENCQAAFYGKWLVTYFLQKWLWDYSFVPRMHELANARFKMNEFQWIFPEVTNSPKHITTDWYMRIRSQLRIWENRTTNII